MLLLVLGNYAGIISLCSKVYHIQRKGPPLALPHRPLPSPSPERPPEARAAARKVAAGLHYPLPLLFSPLALSWG